MTYSIKPYPQTTPSKEYGGQFWEQAVLLKTVFITYFFKFYYYIVALSALLIDLLEVIALLFH